LLWTGPDEGRRNPTITAIPSRVEKNQSRRSQPSARERGNGGFGQPWAAFRRETQSARVAESRSQAFMPIFDPGPVAIQATYRGFPASRKANKTSTFSVPADDLSCPPPRMKPPGHSDRGEHQVPMAFGAADLCADLDRMSDFSVLILKGIVPRIEPNRRAANRPRHGPYRGSATAATPGLVLAAMTDTSRRRTSANIFAEMSESRRADLPTRRVPTPHAQIAAIRTRHVRWQKREERPNLVDWYAGISPPTNPGVSAANCCRAAPMEKPPSGVVGQKASAMTAPRILDKSPRCSPSAGPTTGWPHESPRQRHRLARSRRSGVVAFQSRDRPGSSRCPKSVLPAFHPLSGGRKSVHLGRCSRGSRCLRFAPRLMLERALKVSQRRRSHKPIGARNSPPSAAFICR